MKCDKTYLYSYRTLIDSFIAKYYLTKIKLNNIRISIFYDSICYSLRRKIWMMSYCNFIENNRLLNKIHTKKKQYKIKDYFRCLYLHSYIEKHVKYQIQYHTVDRNVRILVFDVHCIIVTFLLSSSVCYELKLISSFVSSFLLALKRWRRRQSGSDILALQWPLDKENIKETSLNIRETNP